MLTAIYILSGKLEFKMPHSFYSNVPGGIFLFKESHNLTK